VSLSVGFTHSDIGRLGFMDNSMIQMKKCHEIQAVGPACRHMKILRSILGLICGRFFMFRPTVLSVCLQLKDEDVAIVKMDATSNDVPSQYEVHGFPTLYWAPKDAKNSPVRYEVSVSPSAQAYNRTRMRL
jgi:hypothetical protein